MKAADLISSHGAAMRPTTNTNGSKEVKKLLENQYNRNPATSIILPLRIGIGFARYWNGVPSRTVWEYIYLFFLTFAHAEKIPKVIRVRHRFTIQILLNEY